MSVTPTDRSTPPPAATRRWDAWDLVALAVGIIGAVTLLGCAAYSAPGTSWNDARLAPSFALARGLPIYALRDSAGQLGWIYGPVFPLWFLPFGFTDRPTVALILASVWNALTLLLPVGLVLATARVSKTGILLGVALATLGFAAFPGTAEIYHFVHVDATCLALSWGAGLALHRATVINSRRWLAGAALGAVLAFWTKQSAALLLPAFVLWLWRERRRDLIGPLLFWSVVTGGVVTAAIFFYFGPDEVLYNTLLFHLRNPMQTAFARGLLAGAPAFALGLLPCAALAAWTLWSWRTPAFAPPNAPTAALLRLFVLTAIVLLPLGVAAALKVGGNINSLHSQHFLLLVLIVAAMLAWDQRRNRAVGARRIFALVVLLLVAAGWRNALALQESPAPHHEEDDMLLLARAHPGKIYLPWNPLIMIIAERRVYAFDDALLSLYRANLEPPPEKIRALMPPGTLVAYPDPTQSRFALRYLSPAPPTAPAASAAAKDSTPR